MAGRRTRVLAAGAFGVDFPGICKKYGWDAKKLCGPCVCAMGNDPEAYCPEEWNHARGCAAHKPPAVNGKPFKFYDHLDELTKEGLTSRGEGLVKMRKEHKKPPGTPKDVRGLKVYPAWHFG